MFFVSFLGARAGRPLLPGHKWLNCQRVQPQIEELERRELLAASLAAPLHFDFRTNTALVAAGHTGAALTAYTPTLGYGWQSLTGLTAISPDPAADATRGFVRGSDGTFLVDLANGTYNVTPTLGDPASACNQMALYGQGELLASGLTTGAGQFVRPTYQVQVTDGQLELRFVDGGGLTPGFSLDALDITATAPGAGSSSGGASAPVGSAASGRSSTPCHQIASGVYALLQADMNIPSGILSNPSVDGLAVRATWNFLEPAQGVYNWSYLDGIINAAAAADKKVSLSITAGTLTPSWVYKAGAQAFTFIDATSPLTQTLPVPWDPVFLTQWTKLITHLGHRYAGNPTLTQVKITGINISSAETQLPNSPGVQVTLGKRTWLTTNDVADWVAAGYTRAKVENAWQTIADAWSQAFPNQQIASVLEPKHFPPIDNDGDVFVNPQGADPQILADLINLGMTRYGTQFVMQNNALSDFWIMSQTTSSADQVTTGYQMLWFVTGDTTYRMNNGTAIANTTELQNAVNAGLAAHARFLEIYAADITNPALQGVLASAHKGLHNNALPLGMITGLPAPGSVFEGTNTFTLGSALADPTATSANGFTYAWTVQRNGRTIATGSSSSLTFTATDWGDYAVSLQVTDPAGKSSFVNTQTISIINVAPTISHCSYPLSITQGMAATFTAAATDPGPADTAAGLTYTWKFGYDHATATGRRVTYTYLWAGTYNVTLTVTDAGGSSSTITMPITVTRPTHSPEGAAIALSASSFPAPPGASFTGATYAWTVTRNGNTHATGSAANFRFTPHNLSHYIVTLTVTPRTGPSWTNITTYVIDNLPPTITLISVPLSTSLGVAVTMTAAATDPGQRDMAAGLTYTWKFGDRDTATGTSVTHTYNYVGAFTVTLLVSDAEGATTTTTATIVVAKPPHSPEGAAINLKASSFPAPSGVDLTGATYAWTVTKHDNGKTYATGSAATFSFTPNNLSRYDVTLTVTAATGQSWTNSIQYTIENLPPTITSISAPRTASRAASLEFAATATDPGHADLIAGLTFTWVFGDGSKATGRSVDHTYKWRGTYTGTLIVGDREGAKTRKHFTIKVG
jgi:PKD repeat protein